MLKISSLTVFISLIIFKGLTNTIELSDYGGNGSCYILKTMRLDNNGYVELGFKLSMYSPGEKNCPQRPINYIETTPIKTLRNVKNITKDNNCDICN